MNPIERMEKIRNARDNKQHVCIDGVEVDMQTANAIITVYDKVSERNQGMMRVMHINTLAMIAWRVINNKEAV